VRRWIALFLLAFVVTAGAATDPPDPERERWVAQHPVLRIAIDPQQGAEIRGGEANPLVSQYLALVALHTGVRFETVRTHSWEESVKAFTEHRVDLLPSTSDRMVVADLGNRALLSAPFYVGRTLIVTRTVGPAKVDIRDLDGHTVAFKGGGAYESWLRREHPLITRLPLDDIHEVLAAVESGIADAAVGIEAERLEMCGPVRDAASLDAYRRRRRVDRRPRRHRRRAREHPAGAGRRAAVPAGAAAGGADPA